MAIIMWSNVSLALVAVMVASASAADTWINVGGRYLKFFATPKTFSQANRICARIGGHLVYDDNPTIGRYLALTSKYTVNIIHSCTVNMES